MDVGSVDETFSMSKTLTLMTETQLVVQNIIFARHKGLSQRNMFYVLHTQVLRDFSGHWSGSSRDVQWSVSGSSGSKACEGQTSHQCRAN